MMDSDKENKSNPSSTDQSPDGELNNSIAFEHPAEPVSLQPGDPRPAEDFLLQDEPLTEAEQILKGTLPGLGALLERLKLLAPIGGLSHEMLDPVAVKVETQIEGLRSLREQADVYCTDEVIPHCEYLSAVAANLEEELLPILKHFGCGLPTEPWHVDAIRTVVINKLESAKATL